MLLALSDGALALGAGAVLAVGAAAFVLGPLLREEDGAGPSAADAGPTPAAQRATAVDALREIEFDRATGKLSDADYSALKATYTRAALAELRASDEAGVAAGAVAASADDAVEAAIRSYRAAPGSAVACATCGPRPEPDATFCSSCGRYLAGRCGRCGAACEHDGQRFCGDCGHALAA